MRKIFSIVASIPSALEHEKVFGWGSESGSVANLLFREFWWL
jgi:hypothetical protein